MPGVSCSCRRVHTCMCAQIDADACTHTHNIRRWLSYQPRSRDGLNGSLPWASRFWEMQLMQTRQWLLIFFLSNLGWRWSLDRGRRIRARRTEVDLSTLGLAMHLLPRRSPWGQISTGFDQMCTQLQQDQCWIRVVVVVVGAKSSWESYGEAWKVLHGASGLERCSWEPMVCQGGKGFLIFLGACLAFFLRIYQFFNWHVSWQSLRDCESWGEKGEWENCWVSQNPKWTQRFRSLLLFPHCPFLHEVWDPTRFSTFSPGPSGSGWHLSLGEDTAQLTLTRV